MKLPFRRNRTTPDSVPAEIKNYYQAEQRERVGVAWLLAAGVFVVTLLIASGLYFGGKWAYRKITNNDPKPTTSQTEQTVNDGTSDTNGDSKSAGINENPTPSAGAAASSAAAGAAAANAAGQTPTATTPTSASLPNTNGDE